MQRCTVQGREILEWGMRIVDLHSTLQNLQSKIKSLNPAPCTRNPLIKGAISMSQRRHQSVTCQICKKQYSRKQVLHADMVREKIVELIKKERPDWSSEGFICLSDLNAFRAEYVRQSLIAEKGELSALESGVVDSLKEQELLAKNVNVEFDRHISFGARLADSVASFGGSWTFIIIFGCTLLLWIIINSAALLWRPFDPYPYILLNLVLSCIAALQAPVIMMSQNRQEAKDRLRAEQDYSINLKAELEIRHLNAKMDQLLMHQWQRLMDIQEIQMEIMEEGLGRKKI